jgi:hypothetical protein
LIAGFCGEAAGSAGTATAIKTITSMVLISIHPFALRRLFLVVLALAGFSALCFADPVLMAQRYGAEKHRTAANKALVVSPVTPAPDLSPNFESANLSFSIVANAPVTLDEAAIPTRLLKAVASWNSHGGGPIGAFYGTPSDSHFLTANPTD